MFTRNIFRSFGSVAPKVNHLPAAQYGGRFTVAMLPGDGVGPEMMGYVENIFKFAGVPVDFEHVTINKSHNTDGDFENALIAIHRNGVALKGNIESRYGDMSYISRNAALRTKLDLFANVVHCKSFPGVLTRHSDIDLIIIRQNTEGEYTMLEHENVPGVIESLKIVTRPQSRRLARYAFQYALHHGRKRLTVIHKANIMKITDGLFLSTCQEMAKEYPELVLDDMIVDNACMQLVANPQQFDVLIMPNLYGAVISNIASGLVGGSGLVSGKNYGDHYAIFEPGTRSTGTSLAGRNIANPVAMMTAACDLLYHLHLNSYANMIETAINKTINEDKIHTSDLGGQATSLDVVQNILKEIKEEMILTKWREPIAHETHLKEPWDFLCHHSVYRFLT